MKIVIIGGSGLIGSKLVNKLRQLGHEVLPASPASGVNTITGEGLTEALKGTQIVVDVANSPSFEDKAVLEFFQTSGRNLLTAETYAGVKHHIALSIVGTERPNTSGYLRAKLAQENLIIESGIPYTILHSTQFFEFAGAIAQSGTIGQEVHISTGAVQPIASDDVVAALADVVLGTPLNSIVEIAGPVRMRMDEFVGYFLNATNDQRKLVADKHARYFGTELDDQLLVPGQNSRIGGINYEDWFRTQYKKPELQH
jgi:uncharacterized protein YbjT (DUF2867 family)